MYPVSY